MWQFIPKFMGPGDGWAIPVAGAVLFGLVACVLPTSSGRPAVSVYKILQDRGLEVPPAEEGSLEDLDLGSSSDSSPWEVVDPTTATTEEEEEEEEEDGSRHWASNPGVVVFMVDLDKPESECFECAVCQQLIGPGTCYVGWQQNADSEHFHLHSACCTTFAMAKKVATPMFTALVEHQPMVEGRLHGLINMIVHELLDLTKSSHDAEMNKRKKTLQEAEDERRKQKEAALLDETLTDTLAVGSAVDPVAAVDDTQTETHSHSRRLLSDEELGLEWPPSWDDDGEHRENPVEAVSVAELPTIPGDLVQEADVSELPTISSHPVEEVSVSELPTIPGHPEAEEVSGELP